VNYELRSLQDSGEAWDSEAARDQVKPTARRGHQSWTGGGRCTRNGQDYQAKGLLLPNPGIRARSRQVTFSCRLLEAVKIFMPCRKQLTYGERPSNDEKLILDNCAGHELLSDALNCVGERRLKRFIFEFDQAERYPKYLD
jgi:hypothetical protein